MSIAIFQRHSLDKRQHEAGSVQAHTAALKGSCEEFLQHLTNVCASECVFMFVCSVLRIRLGGNYCSQSVTSV